MVFVTTFSRFFYKWIQFNSEFVNLGKQKKPDEEDKHDKHYVPTYKNEVIPNTKDYPEAPSHFKAPPGGWEQNPYNRAADQMK